MNLSLSYKKRLMELGGLLTENKKIDVLTDKVGLEKSLAEDIYAFSDKYCVWIGNVVKSNGDKVERLFFQTNKTNFQNIIDNLFQVDNKPITNISDIKSTEDATEKINILSYIKDWSENPNSEPINLKNMSWGEAIRKSTEWHESLKQGEGQADERGDTIIHKFDDGYYWMMMKRSYDQMEGKLMGHCGNASDSDMYLLSLRKNKKPYVTADYHPQEKYIIQIKGKQNQKPDKKYHKYILWLISDEDRVKELKTDEGYMPENSFQLDDIGKENIIKVLNKNKGLLLNISDDVYNMLSDNLKLEYINMCVKTGRSLSNTQYKDAPNDLKLEYIKICIETGIGLTKMQYNDTPDNLKLEYIKVRIKSGISLSDTQYEDAPDNLKLEYIQMFAKTYFGLTENQYNTTPDNLRKKYIEMRVEYGWTISETQYNDAPDNLKLYYINMCIKNVMNLTNTQYNDTPDNLKLEYIKMRVNNGLLLTPQQKSDYNRLKKI